MEDPGHTSGTWGELPDKVSINNDGHTSWSNSAGEQKLGMLEELSVSITEKNLVGRREVALCVAVCDAGVGRTLPLCPPAT